MRKRGQSNFPVTPTLLSSYWKIALTPFSAGKDLDVLERRVVGDGDLVLDQHAAVRAAELSELRCWIDEAPRIADERVRRLDRQVVAHAVSLVVVADRAEVGAALRAAVVLVREDGEGLGGEELRCAADFPQLPLAGMALQPPRAELLAPALGGFRIARDDAVEQARGVLGDVAILDVGLDLRRIALERIAEAAARGPEHGIDVGRALREVLLAKLQRLGLAFQLVDVADQLGAFHPLEDVRVLEELVAVHRARIAAHHAGRGGNRVARRKRVVRDLVGAVRDEARLGRQAAAPFPGTARVHYFFSIQKQDGERLLGMLDVRQLADRRARLAAGRDAVGVREGADRAADRINQQVAVALAPLVDAAEDGRRPLARAADAHHVAPQLW